MKILTKDLYKGELQKIHNQDAKSLIAHRNSGGLRQRQKLCRQLLSSACPCLCLFRSLHYFSIFLPPDKEIRI